MSEDDRSSGLTRRTLAGLSWTYLQTFLGAAMQIGVTAALARLLAPDAFGLVAIGSLSLRFVNYFARAGMTQAVIQKADLTDDDVRAAWTSSLAFGLVFGGLVVAAAPLAADVFNDPDVIPVLRVLALDLVFFGLGATATALLRRALRFRAIALRDISAYVLGYPVVGLILALNGAGVWALVAATLTQTFMSAVLAFAASPHSLRFSTHGPSYRAVLGFGGRVSVISFLEFLGDELDTFAVGRYASTSALGLYNRAYLLARLPLYQLASGLSKVLFPSFSAVQDQLPRLRSAFLTAVGVATSLLVPIAAGMAVASAELVEVLLGDQWLDAIPVMPPLIGVAVVAMISHFAAIAAEARAFLNQKMMIAATKVVVLVGLLAVAADGPLAGFGLALLGAAVVNHAMYLWLIRRVLDVTLATVLRQYVPGALAGVLVAAAIGGARVGLLSATEQPLVVLTGEIATGAVALLACFWFGPLRSVRFEIGKRLENAGMLSGDGTLARWLQRVLRPASAHVDGRS